MTSRVPKGFPVHLPTVELRHCCVQVLFKRLQSGRRRTSGRDESKNLFALESSLTELSVSSSESNDLNDDDDDDSFRTGPLGLNQLSSPTEPLI
jgi:hypothetical protein